MKCVLKPNPILAEVLLFFYVTETATHRNKCGCFHCYSLSIALCILFGNFKVQCQCSENECGITDTSFPGVHELVTAQTPWYFYFLEGERVEWEFHTPDKIKWIQESDIWTVTCEGEDEERFGTET